MAREAFANGDIPGALKYINHCAVLAQQFNWIYADDGLEDLLSDIGRKVLSGSAIEDYEPLEDRVVFYDDFCTSFVLALQYVRALVAAGYQVLYITPKRNDGRNRFETILDEVGSYPGVKAVSLPESDDPRSTIGEIYRLIVDYQAAKVLLHIKSYSLSIPALSALPDSIERYIINLADQTFWLGKKAIDYSLEFRPFGASVSLQRRGLGAEQLLMVPFYPVTDSNPFEGFPAECTPDKVIIFSGGDLYKVVDEKKTYWKLVKRILDTYPQVVFLFATKVNKNGTEMIERFIDENGFRGRFIHIGFRRDINEVFRHCDIFMGTCPASGSLMSQLAAVNAKPILQYYCPGTPDDETEQAVCFNGSLCISYQDERSFLEEAGRLISDRPYRTAQGAGLKDSLIRVEQFNAIVSDTIKTDKTAVEIKQRDVDYHLLDNRWFDLEKTGFVDTLPYLVSILGKERCLRKLLSVMLKKYIRQILK